MCDLVDVVLVFDGYVTVNMDFYGYADTLDGADWYNEIDWKKLLTEFNQESEVAETVNFNISTNEKRTACGMVDPTVLILHRLAGRWKLTLN